VTRQEWERATRTRRYHGFTPAEQEMADRLRRWDPGPGAPLTSRRKQPAAQPPAPAGTSVVGSLLVFGAFLLLVVVVVLANVGG
jgi:hypothetical protein